MSGCSVVSDKPTSSLFTASRKLRTFDSKKVTQLKPDSTRQDVGKGIKYSFVFCAAEDAGEKGAFVSISNLKSFSQAVNFRWTTQKLLCPANFTSSPVAP
jgi:hypothetical protein